MSSNKTYLFTSERLGFREWHEDDITLMAALNADEEVMEFFPSTYDEEQTRGFVARMRREFIGTGYCYFAVDRLDTGAFIGFIGFVNDSLSAINDGKTFIDFGWRLSKNAWGNGFATEGAKRCLDHAFNTLGLQTLNAKCPVVNHRSENVMKKAGMTKVMNFLHPKLAGNERLQECALYEKHK
jgi:RimJ/RimL family protein N-acetyltransferase